MSSPSVVNNVEISSSSETAERDDVSREAEELLKDIEEARDAIGQAEKVKNSDPLPPKKLSLEIPTRARAIAREVAPVFPHPADAFVRAAVDYQELASKRIQDCGSVTQAYMKTTDELLALSAEFFKTGEESAKTQQISENAHAILKRLKERGIDLGVKEETKELAKEDLRQLQLLLDARTNENKTKVQLEFNKIQEMISLLNAILDSCKNAIRREGDAAEKLIRNQTGR